MGAIGAGALGATSRASGSFRWVGAAIVALELRVAGSPGAVTRATTGTAATATTATPAPTLATSGNAASFANSPPVEAVAAPAAAGAAAAPASTCLLYTSDAADERS